MKRGTFLIKLVCLAIVLGCIFYYQSVAQVRSAEAAENEAAVAEAEAYNKDIERQIREAEKALAQEAEAEAETEDEGLYLNGTWYGQAMGYGGMISVSVTVEDGYIDKIEVTDHHTEDPAYYMLAESVVALMESEQGSDVDTVSGATLSSTGLINAVSDALMQAEKQTEN